MTRTNARKRCKAYRLARRIKRAAAQLEPFYCPLCGQRIDDGKMCGCGARR